MKKSQKVAAFACALTVLVGTALGAQQSPPGASGPASAQTLPTAAQVLERYIQALGGKAAYEKLTSRVSEGSTEVPDQGAVGSTEIFEKAPNKYLSVSQYQGYGTVKQAFDGTAGWSDDPEGGLSEVSGARLAVFKRNVDFYHPLKLAELYTSMAVKGKETVRDREAFVIEAMTPEGLPELLYFDAETGLLLHVNAARQAQSGRVRVQAYFDDYREVDGIKVPFKIEWMSPSRTLITRLSRVVHNVSIEDARFAKPAPRQ